MKTERSGKGAEAALHGAVRRGRALFCTDAEGNALIETALVLPLMLAILTSIFSFGSIFNNKVTLTNATGIAAQRLQQLRTSTSDPCLDTFNVLAAAAPGLDPTKVSMRVTLNGAAYPSSTTMSLGTANSCSSTAAIGNLVTGSTVKVETSYPCTINVVGYTPSTSCNITATVVEYEY